MKRSFFPFLLAAIAVAAISGCTKCPDAAIAAESTAPFDLEAAKKIIMEKNLKFCEAHITGDTAFLNNIFTSDARIFVPNAAVVTDKQVIRDINMEYVNYGITEFTEVTTAFYGNEEFLVDEGTYVLVWGEDNSRDVGKYINVWKPENGEWKMQTNVWNSDLPVE